MKRYSQKFLKFFENSRKVKKLKKLKKRRSMDNKKNGSHFRNLWKKFVDKKYKSLEAIRDRSVWLWRSLALILQTDHYCP